jgi:hypothetical protein
MNTVVIIFRGASKVCERGRFRPGTSGVTHPVGSLAPLHPTASFPAGEPGRQLADVNHLGKKVCQVYRRHEIYTCMYTYLSMCNNTYPRFFAQ